MGALASPIWGSPGCCFVHDVSVVAKQSGCGLASVPARSPGPACEVGAAARLHPSPPSRGPRGLCSSLQGSCTTSLAGFTNKRYI